VLTEGSLRQALRLTNFEFTLIALLLQVLAFAQAHGVRVLVNSVLGKFERVEPETLS